MASLGTTIANLARYKRTWANRLSTAELRAPGPGSHLPSPLEEVTGFGSNPGELTMLTYVPANLADSPALVVVLHGCTQTAAEYDLGAGWSTLADRHGFALLLPEQRQTNNPQTCFNWFLPGDTARDRGEALSIRQMVDRMVRDHGIDPKRVFVTGLSAGGAMTSVMLATYPEVFAGGAIIAGLPYGTATSVPEAFELMFRGRPRSAKEWGDLVRSASPHQGSWPTVSIWHGSADTTVTPANATEIVKQWTDLHGLPLRPDREDVVDGYPRKRWRDGAGRDLVTQYMITGMAHGTPLAVADGSPLGVAGPFFIDAGISSTHYIAAGWGLTTHRARKEHPHHAVNGHAVRESGQSGAKAPAQVDIRAVIAKALRAAGLVR